MHNIFKFSKPFELVGCAPNKVFLSSQYLDSTMATIVDTHTSASSNILYVGDLHPCATELKLYHEFAKFGTVVTITLYRASRPYAYVHFTNGDDAQKARQELNYQPLDGVPIRIMRFDQNPNQRRSTIGNIFIKNLDKNITTISLYDTFSIFGVILSCKVAMDANGISKGFGFVHFEEERCAEEAIAKVNGALLNDIKVFVGKFIPKTDRREFLGDRYDLFNNLYVKNIPKDYTEEDVKKLFEVIGEIGSVKVVTDENENSRGFGFVCYKEFNCAKTAIEQLHGKEINGKRLYVSRAEKKVERQERLHREYHHMISERRRCNLYIGFLHSDIDDTSLAAAFQQFGTITSAKVMMANNRSRGYGFVCYSSREEASAAMDAMNGKILQGKRLYVSFSATEEERLREVMIRDLIASYGFFTPLLNIPMPSTIPVPGTAVYVNGICDQQYPEIPQASNSHTERNERSAENETTRKSEHL